MMVGRQSACLLYPFRQTRYPLIPLLFHLHRVYLMMWWTLSAGKSVRSIVVEGILDEFKRAFQS